VLLHSLHLAICKFHRLPILADTNLISTCGFGIARIYYTYFLYYLSYDLWYFHNTVFWLQREMCMAIIVANGPALKVFWNEMHKTSWSLPNGLPRLKIVWSGSKAEIQELPISRDAPKLSTIQVSRFQVSQIMPESHLRSQTETMSTLRSSRSDDDHFSQEWKDKRRGTYNDNDFMEEKIS
jgi:hypothetical protein